MVTERQFTVTEQNGVWQVRVIERERSVQEFRCATTDQVHRLLRVLGGSFEVPTSAQQQMPAFS